MQRVMITIDGESEAMGLQCETADEALMFAFGLYDPFVTAEGLAVWDPLQGEAFDLTG